MHKLGRYTETASMSDLICEHYPVLLVLSRFNIPLGFGERNIGEVCRDNGVDTDTFLAIVNMLVAGDEGDAVTGRFSIDSLVSYLHNSHDYFLGFRLPDIREELVGVVGMGNDLAKAIIAYFDEYVAEVRQHMMYEEQNLFPYIESLLAGEETSYDVDTFRRQHDQVEARLTEFKNILLKYYPSKSTNEINRVLFDIFSCEKDLASHNAVEDRMLVPAIEQLEKEKPHRA